MKATVLYGARDVRFETRPDPVIVKPTDAILRMSSAERWAQYQTMLGLSAVSVNWVRSKEDMPPIDDPAYDQPGIPGTAAVAAPAAP